MKVLEIVSHLNSGGITTYVYSLSKVLVKRGIQVGICSGGGSYEGKFKDMGVKLFHIPIRVKNEFHPKVFKSFFMLDSIRREFDFDIIHAHTRSSQILSSLYRKIRGVKFVTTCHGYFKKRISRKIFKCWGDKTIAISPQVKDHLQRDFGIEEDKIEVVPTGVDTDELDMEERMDFFREKGIKATGPFIGSLGRLSSVKNYDLLLKAFQVFSRKFPGSFLGIMGDGPERIKLLSLAKELALEDKFGVFGDEHRAAFLKSLDIFCLPSESEGLGLAALEAMYMQRPVLVSRKGGLKFVIKDRENGLFIQDLMPEGVAESLINIWEDKDLREKLGKNARIYVKENFSLQVMADKILDIYKEIAGNVSKK